MTQGLASATYEVANIAEAIEFYFDKGWTDGLPVVPPTADAVRAGLDVSGLEPGHELGTEPVRGRVLTAEKVAVNAVMAGCLAAHVPVVMTAVEAMLEEQFLLHGATASTGGCAVLAIINGPIVSEFGMDPTFNVLGNGDRAAAVIGRAIRLVLMNLLDVRPGRIDRSTLGHPGKFSYAMAEDEERDNALWPSLAAQRGVPDGESCVTVFAAMSPRQLMNEWTRDPSEVADTFASEMRANMLNYSIWGGNYVVVVPRQLRGVFSDGGWGKAELADALFERARIHRRDWRSAGKSAVVSERNEDTEYRALRKPEDLLAVGGGGPAGGFGAVIAPWLGYRSRAVTRVINRP